MWCQKSEENVGTNVKCTAVTAHANFHTAGVARSGGGPKSSLFRNGI